MSLDGKAGVCDLGCASPCFLGKAVDCRDRGVVHFSGAVVSAPANSSVVSPLRCQAQSGLPPDPILKLEGKLSAGPPVLDNHSQN